MEKNPCTEARLDKWLWAARIFKTRQLAAKAISGGHVVVNNGRAKPARMIRAGDELRIRKGPYIYELTVLALSHRRGSATVAKSLYSESESSQVDRDRLAKELKTQASQILYDPKKPSKRARRQTRLWKREKF